MKNLLFALLLTVCSLNASSEGEPMKPHSLTVSEGFVNPIGFYDAVPSFSWKLPVLPDVKSQSAYRIIAASDPALLPDKPDLWDTGKEDSEESVWIRYKGKKLESRRKVWWQVMFWDQNGKASSWSETAHFELGLLQNEDWSGEWICLPAPKKKHIAENGYLFFPPEYLRKEFVLPDNAKEARLYITAKGVFEAEINGKRVGHDVMTPGWTPYHKRIETLTYDVTESLSKGANALGVTIAEGWHSGRIAYSRDYKGERPNMQLLCQLEVLLENGQKITVRSDGDWKGTRNGPIRFSGIYDGEDYDARLEIPGWSTVGFGADDWTAVETEPEGNEVMLLPKRHEPVTDKLVLQTIQVTQPAEGLVVFDLGQNMVGVPLLNVPVKRGQTLKVRFAEMLNTDGTLYTENYRSARSADHYIPGEDGTMEWKPKFTFHGFRYVELSGYDASAEPKPEWVRGVVQYSDFERTGEFESSHDKLNQLQSNILWGLRGNFFDIPTDCPQRDERMGWTGDAQVFTPASLFNCDVYSFWTAWLQSMREEQQPDGAIPMVIPNNRKARFSSGWADAATVIPWELYQKTGDLRVLEENYEMMKGVVSFYGLDKKDRVTTFASFGDWLQPYSNHKTDKRFGDTPTELIDAAYYFLSTELTAKAAALLGKEKDATELRKLANSLKKAFFQQYFDEKGKLTTKFDTQTGYLLALAFGLVPDERIPDLTKNLLYTIEAADNHLRTGFLGTPLLAPVLDKMGQADLMYEILFKETYPSWFYSINQGATTMWERWNSYSHTDGFGDAGMNSFNHYAYGAIGQWMYERIGGISPLEPGYKKIRIAPVPGGSLEQASAEYESVYGKISSTWEETDSGLKLKVTIPPNTTGRIDIPCDKEQKLLLNGNAIAKDLGVQNFSRNETHYQIDVIPGSYLFETAL